MSLPVPLSVLLITDRGAFRVTKQARDLTFRSTSPGGFASCRVPLDRPLKIQPDDVQYFGRMIISDTQTGSVVWEGQLADPSRSAGPDGQVWELTGIGPSGHAKDRNVPLIYADKRLNVYVPAVGHEKVINVGVGDQLAARITFDIPRGTICDTTFDGEYVYREISEAGQTLARASCGWGAGTSDADWSLRLYTRAGSGASTVADSDPATGSPFILGTLAAARGDGTKPITAGHDVLGWGIRRINTTQTVANDQTWFIFYDIAVRAMLKTAAGTDITSGYTADTVLASEVVADLLGRLLPLYDGATASIATTSTAIDQLAYPDGITPHDVLADLMQLEAAYTWHAWERTSSGKHRFEWVTWPTTVRYEADIRDGYTSQGSADGLYDRVRVRWRASDGQIRSTLRTQTVPSLASAGRPREAIIDLGGEVGSLTNAETVGDNFLADHLHPPNAGSLTVARKILDRLSGRMVAPWEIRPGNLIRVRGIDSRADALNATGSDGVSVFRIVSTEFQARDASATLELDSYSRSTARALASATSFRIRR